MQGIYLSLGTNLGNREENLLKAKELLNAYGIVVAKESCIYQTAAWGKADQPQFLNQVIMVSTKLSPAQLLVRINQVEQEMGRVRKEKWGERLIDIDILYYQDEIVDDPELKIPHPEIQNRRFVLVPLAEIATEEIHPILQKTQRQLLESVKDDLTVDAK